MLLKQKNVEIDVSAVLQLEFFSTFLTFRYFGDTHFQVNQLI
jgi:hypothetical protein